jgi:glutaminase
MGCLENYFRQCSLLVDCRDLALMAATLANGGIHPVSGRRALAGEHVERVLSVMATCGMYDFAGSWLYEIGMPAKSGVGGGIISVLPGRFGIGIFSPLLDAKGNSVRGIEVCRHLSRDFGLHVFKRGGVPSMALGRVYTAAEAPSRRKPSPEMRGYLDEHAHRIKYLCLHGYLAVDGVEYIIRQMIEMADASTCFILDMHQVDGISENAARLLNDARLCFVGENIGVVFSRIHARPAIEGPLGKTSPKGDRGFLSFEDNDLAVEWCENRLLGDRLQANAREARLADCQLLNGLSPELLKQVECVAGEMHFATGAAILTSGEPSDGGVYFIGKGRVSILVPLGDGAHQRIASLGPGMNFGEMVLLGKSTRSATVVADDEVQCWVLKVDEINRLASESPQLKILLLENILRSMAESLRRATQWIGALA